MVTYSHGGNRKNVIKRISRIRIEFRAFFGSVEKYPMKNIKKRRLHGSETLKILP